MKRIATILAVAFAVATFGCQTTAGDHDKHADHKHANHKHHDHDDHAKSVSIAWNDVPANVRTAFEKEFPSVKVTECERETYANGVVHYEFEYTDATGKEHEIEFSADGEKLEPHDD